MNGDEIREVVERVHNQVSEESGLLFDEDLFVYYLVDNFQDVNEDTIRRILEGCNEADPEDDGDEADPEDDGDEAENGRRQMCENYNRFIDCVTQGIRLAIQNDPNNREGE